MNRPARLGVPRRGSGERGGAIDRFVAALRRELAERDLSRAPFARRLLEETEDHLLERADELQRAGHPRSAAEALAVGRMGSPEELIVTWESELAATPAGRQASLPTLRALGGTLMNLSLGTDHRWLKTGLWSTAGLLAGAVLAIPAGRVAGLATMMLILPAIGAAVGLGLGVAQSRAARGRGVLSRRWWLASALGMAIGLTGGTALIEQLDLSKGLWSHDLLALAIIGGSVGLVLSLAQAWALEAPSGLRVRWVLGSCLALAAAFVIGGLAAYGLIGGIRQLAGLAVLALVTSLAAGGATACLLETVLSRAGAGRIAA